MTNGSGRGLPLADRKFQTVGRVSLPDCRRIRRAILVQKPFDAIRSGSQLKIDVGVSYFIACGAVADDKEDRILVRKV